jgi:hypothetical protein
VGHLVLSGGATSVPFAAVLPGPQQTATVPYGQQEPELNSRIGPDGPQGRSCMHEVTKQVPVLLEVMGPVAPVMVRC